MRKMLFPRDLKRLISDLSEGRGRDLWDSAAMKGLIAGRSNRLTAPLASQHTAPPDLQASNHSKAWMGRGGRRHSSLGQLQNRKVGKSNLFQYKSANPRMLFQRHLPTMNIKFHKSKIYWLWIAAFEGTCDIEHFFFSTAASKKRFLEKQCVNKPIIVRHSSVLCRLLPGRASRPGKCFADDQRGSRLSSLGQRLHLLEAERGHGGLERTLESHLWTRCLQRQQLWVVALTCVPENRGRRGNKVSKRRSDSGEEERRRLESK